MMLVIDSTQPDALHLGLKKAGGFRHARFALPAGYHDTVLPSLTRFLQRERVSLKNLRSLLVVLGPGRFTSLRVAATISNIMSWQLKLKLYGARSIPFRPNAVIEYLTALEQRKRPIAIARPWYGSPPSITTSKKTAKNRRKRSMAKQQ